MRWQTHRITSPKHDVKSIHSHKKDYCECRYFHLYKSSHISEIDSFARIFICVFDSVASMWHHKSYFHYVLILRTFEKRECRENK